MAEAQTWEYHVVDRGGWTMYDGVRCEEPDLRRLLKDMGGDGWELVATTSGSVATAGFGRVETHPSLYFKRPVGAPPPSRPRT